jgi:hypothetical protein
LSDRFAGRAAGQARALEAFALLDPEKAWARWLRMDSSSYDSAEVT